jgi:hypothetical protein
MSALLLPAVVLTGDLAVAMIPASPPGVLMLMLLGVTAFLLRRWQ